MSHEENNIEIVDEVVTIDTDKKLDSTYAALASAYNEIPVAKKKNETTLVNKRIDFDPRTLKRIEMMLPAYRDESGDNASVNDVMSLVIAKGIDALFDNDFKKKIEEM